METDFQRALYDRTFGQGQFSGSFEQFVNLIRIVRDDLAATGNRCDPSAIDQLLNRAEFAHVKPRHARIHETDFKLVFEDSVR
jgi:hypothetical protein